MDKQKGPTGFIVVLPGEVIEIPQDSDKSWLTLFYSLPRELAEKCEYYGTAEPPVRCGESHLSGLTEPLHFVY